MRSHDRTFSLQPKERSHFFPSTSPKGDRTLSLQPNPNAIALPPLNLTQTRLPSAQAKLIALPPLNLIQRRSHSLPSTESPRDRLWHKFTEEDSGLGCYNLQVRRL
ncbi:MAG: hypothetical protein RID53_26245 [Coleofasciculus sp. B1-GNL1-01]|uniref:hypothetical protein n=1 Tax=Coleofasciculus sp. B1-GNL1-01 TaxID=3068484 RepID=UPI003300229C